jgi:hypothetical protein
MTFQSAIAEAPKDADFVGYKNIGGWVIIQRRSDGAWDTCANLNNVGYDLFVSGVNARGKSYWSYESRMFMTGTVEQLSRHAEENFE